MTTDPQPGSKLLHNLLLFGRVCRAFGLDVTPNRMMEAAQALAHIDLLNRDDFYHALRLYLVHNPRQIAPYHEAFEMFWQRPSEGWSSLDIDADLARQLQHKQQILPQMGEGSSGGEAGSPLDPGLTTVMATYSTQERLRHKDFADMTEAELLEARAIMAKLPRALGMRRTRRYRQGRGSRLDLRRVMRQSLRHQGEVLSLPTRRLKLKPRPVVLICDISGSMERYTRVLLHFMHILTQGMAQVETFVFSTSLTRITHPIRHRSIELALRDVGRSVDSWGGGTMTGVALRQFNYRWSRRVLGRGAVVILITDGWDRGDIDLLAHEAGRLRRSCHRLIWLNPLLDLPEYEPLTRGAQALLPHVDDFLPIRSLANLERLIRALADIKAL